jgi:hypothetical protein
MAGTTYITKCDKCGTEIDGPGFAKKSICVRVGIGSSIELCVPCARPIARYLWRSQLLEVQLEQQRFIKRPTTRSSRTESGTS